MAREMVLDAERRGVLRPGGRIVESTSGNTGLGLAVIAAERGYAFTAVVDHHACRDKLRAMMALGAELVYVADDGDDNLATAAREELAERMAAATAGRASSPSSTTTRPTPSATSRVAHELPPGARRDRSTS